MAAWNCGWCGKHAHMAPRGLGYNIPAPDGARLAIPEGGSSVMFTTMECASCAGLSVAFTPRNVSGPGPSNMDGMTEFWRHEQPYEWAPKWIEGQDFDYVPDHIGQAASEAYKCNSIGAHMAAILMARTSIEAAAKDHGVKSGNLKAKIDKLAEDGLIRSAIKDAAHQVRMFGNDMAHGDISETVSEEDSAPVLQLLTFILEDLYQVKSLMGKVGISLDARKSGVEE